MGKDDFALKIFADFEKKIRAKIYNWKIVNSDLVEDTLHEIFIIFSERIKKIRKKEAIPNFLEYWITLGVNRTIRKYFPEIRTLKKNKIEDFDKKLEFLVTELGYEKEEAERFIIIEESLRKSHIIAQIDLHVEKSNDFNPRSHHSGWIDRFRTDFPELNDYDRVFVIDAIKFCFGKLQRTGGKYKDRDANVMRDIFLYDEKQEAIAKKYGLSPARITQIKSSNLPKLQKCLTDKLGLESNRG